MNRMLIPGVCIALAAVSACATIPMEQRVATYETEMKARFVGKSADELVLALGPPDSSFELSDGREILQYESERRDVRGGDTYVDYASRIGWSYVTRSDGSRVRVATRYDVPVVRQTPVFSVNRVCVNRFVVDVNNVVQDFRWEGNACF